MVQLEFDLIHYDVILYHFQYLSLFPAIVLLNDLALNNHEVWYAIKERNQTYTIIHTHLC